MRKALIVVGVLLVSACGLLSLAQPSADQGGYPPQGQYNRQGQRYDQRNDPRLNRYDRRSLIVPLSAELVQQAEYMSQNSYEYYQGWNGTINDAEQAILFKSEEFAASCRLFHKLVQDQSGFFRRDVLRTNLFNAYRYVAANFRQMEEQMRRGGMVNDFSRMRRDGRSFQPRIVQPQGMNRQPGYRFGLNECRRILSRIEAEFTSWR